MGFTDWTPTNIGTIFNVLNNSARVDSTTEVNSDATKRATIEVTEEYPWQDEVLGSILMWDTAKISHILKNIADMVFDDVESAYVHADEHGNVIGTLYFSYNGEKKTENGLLAFSTINKTVPTDIVHQVINRMQQQKSGEVVMTKEAMDIMSNWVFVPGLDKSKPNWPKNIRWNDLVEVVPSASKYGCSIRLTNIRMDSIISMIIKSLKETTVKQNGEKVEVKRDLYVEVKPSARKATNPMERFFEIRIIDLEKSQRITEAVAPNMATRLGNPYMSYT